MPGYLRAENDRFKLSRVFTKSAMNGLDSVHESVGPSPTTETELEQLEAERREVEAKLRRMIRRLGSDIEAGRIGPRAVARRVKKFYEGLVDAHERGIEVWPIEDELVRLFDRAVGISDGCDDYAVVLSLDDWAVFVEVSQFGDVYVDVIKPDAKIRPATSMRLSHYIVKHEPYIIYPRK